MCLVVGDGVEVVVVAAVEHGVNHAAGDTKHGTTSVLDLAVEGAVTLLNILDLGGEGVSSGDGTRGSIVSTGEVLGASGVLAGGHGDGLGEEAEDGDLGKAEGGDVAEGGETGSDGVEGDGSVKVDGTGEGDVKLLDHHADEGNHGDTAVLDLNGTTTGEGVGVLHESKGIEEVEGSGVDSEAIGGAGITVDGGGDASSLGRREGDGGGGEGGGDDKLHDCCFVTGSSLQQLMERRKRNGSGETIDQKDAQ